MIIAIVLMAAIIVFAVLLISKIISGAAKTNTIPTINETLSNGTVIKVDYLNPNPYSRPQISLKKVKGIVIHYTANPGTSAKANRSYFQGLAKKKAVKASSHYIVGLEGEVIQCIPLTEIAYASNERNYDTISIESCHPDETGKLNDNTYESLVTLAAHLCIEFGLDEEDVIRHYDVTQKMCPKYYVENEDAWLQLKADVKEEIDIIRSNLNEPIND